MTIIIIVVGMTTKAMIVAVREVEAGAVVQVPVTGAVEGALVVHVLDHHHPRRRPVVHHPRRPVVHHPRRHVVRRVVHHRRRHIVRHVVHHPRSHRVHPHPRTSIAIDCNRMQSKSIEGN